MTVNPKEAFGRAKPDLSNVSPEIFWLLGAAMREGANKYGRYNYLETEISASTYYNAAMRHIHSAWMGEDIDAESGLPHLVKAMACLAVWYSAQRNGTFDDDRPQHIRAGVFFDELKRICGDIDKRTLEVVT